LKHQLDVGLLIYDQNLRSDHLVNNFSSAWPYPNAPITFFKILKTDLRIFQIFLFKFITLCEIHTSKFGLDRKGKCTHQWRAKALGTFFAIHLNFCQFLLITNLQRVYF